SAVLSTALCPSSALPWSPAWDWYSATTVFGSLTLSDHPSEACTDLPVRVMTADSVGMHARTNRSAVPLSIQLGVSLESVQLVSGLRIPSPHRVVNPPRHDAPAVRGERHADDTVSVSLEGEDRLSRLSVPHPHRVIPARRGDALAVRGERHAVD